MVDPALFRNESSGFKSPNKISHGIFRYYVRFTGRGEKLAMIQPRIAVNGTSGSQMPLRRLRIKDEPRWGPFIFYFFQAKENDDIQ